MLNVDLDKVINLYDINIILIFYSVINKSAIIIYIFDCIKNINKLNHVHIL
jgi:hypothetical protein